MDDNVNDEPMTVEELQGEVYDLEAQIVDLAKKLDAANSQDPEAQKVGFDPYARLGADFAPFEQTVNEIKKRDNCSRTDALAKARKENPEGYENFLAGTGTNADSEIVITKGEKHPFEKVVDSIMQQEGCSRAVAMQRARKKEPVKFAHYQEQD
jgi:hypothetical protein